MISSLDRNIMLVLEEDGRTPSVKIARELGIHPSTVSKKIKQMLDDHTFEIRAIPNLNKLGYTAQAFITITAESGKIDSICKKLNNHFHVNMLVITFGKTNILITVHFHSWESLLNFTANELNRIDGVLKTESYYIKDTFTRYHGLFPESTASVTVDDINQHIITRLSEDGRLTAQLLAGELGISLPACSRRINYLIQEDIIRIRALTNPSRLGYIANAFLLLKVTPDKIDSICAQLIQNNEIMMVLTLYNNYDILLNVHAKNTESLFRIIQEKVQSIPDITDIETFIRSEVVKRYFGGFLTIKERYKT